MNRSSNHDEPKRRSSDARNYLSRTAPVVPPIYQTATFQLDEISYADVLATGGLNEDWYSRFRNPTVSFAADLIAELEGAQSAVMTSSGMGAIATTLLTYCRAGDRILAGRELYGDTRDLLVRDLPRVGIKVDFVPTTDISAWQAALEEAPTALVYAETLTNPQLRALDIDRVAELAHAAGARLVVDNTFASAFVVQPLLRGADIVVHSATKYLSGHSDVIAGCVVADEETIFEIQRRVITFGTSLDPHAAFLVSRGLRTYDVRLGRQQQTARAIAQWLTGAPGVNDVIYPGLGEHLDRAVIGRVWSPDRTGAMVTFVVEGGIPRAAELMRQLHTICEATSLGGVETLISMPHNSSHFSYTDQELEAAGIVAGMLRLSVGLEPAAELISDLEQALGQPQPAAAGVAAPSGWDE